MSAFPRVQFIACAIILCSFASRGQSGTSQDSCTSSIDIITLMNVYGTSVPDVEIAMHNHHQDIYAGESYLGQLSRIDGIPIFNADHEWQISNGNYSFKWFINDSLVSYLANPKVNDLDSLVSGEALPCDGVVRLRQEIKAENIAAVFSREVWAFIDFNSLANCACDSCPDPGDIFYPFYPEDYEPHDYIIAHSPLDRNEDNIFDSFDLLWVISSYCAP